ncbi:MAG: flagellar protein FlbB [Alphaproteobacteria bacterium]|nr:flagellar protein FlbB [Alphaproteobacteria bacterium]
MKMDVKSFIRKLRILPILIVVASFGFVVRLGDTYMNFRSISGSAYAEESIKSKDEKKPEVEAEVETEANKSTPAVEEKREPSQDELKSGDSKIEEKSANEEPKKWEDASDTDSADSSLKNEVFQDLIKRREELDQRDKKLSEREALLEAAQKELDKKVSEMEAVRDELKDLLKQQTAEEATRIQSLVKIYSGMKPKDAARIFNTLDTDILMDVISSMPEAKAGPIIALMDADRAKALTTLLAEQKKLPEMP